MDKKYIEENTVFLTITGSHAYGTSIEGSDIDTRGIAIIPDLSYYFGFLKKFEQSEDDLKDHVIYDIRKAMHLMSENNPNMLELLFIDEQFHKKIHPVFLKVIENRNIFLSKKVRFTYLGYAYSQLKRIKTARG